MQRHVSVVGNITLLSIGLGSTLQIGDTNFLLLRSRAIAVQRELPIYRGNEIEFSDFDVFTDTDLTVPKRVTDVRMNVVNVNPFLHVGSLEFSSTENSAVIHIGSVEYGQSNSRIHQIRQYMAEDETEEASVPAPAYNATTHNPYRSR
ncbi:spore germination protein GerPE [Ectobacillus ponti]|uniref:Spore germination protein GerPE n=1 Tax=Ectobacillus ponti TaxID=2961894 RepID=A0AA41X8H5_9BACI|nr:spore germination protein GerPE [Ectobacillus ponti]MCP8968243.1 spore germination protein GerPE [Ectobacillus ponti]